MVYHVTCPFSGEVYSFQTKNEIRSFVAGMMRAVKDCDRKIPIMRGKQRSGVMWKDGNVIYYRTTGVREKRIVNNDGSTRRI